MHIKSIVLEGFKSYAQRTEIYGFDPEFNAITGLNGSGKSNILDGICFLLGITNLSHVRALNLNELVYKNGQAGVTKATVSITFDNSDKDQCPLGYAECNEITVTRQITIGDRNKYLINGHQASNQRVHDLFCSVQLNINNPHFLIMQGRITKVLNMKPAEILSMVEEATGTRLYEDKRELTCKMLLKKEAKLSDIDKKILEELNPCIEKLREDREAYKEFQEINRELDHLQKFHIAFNYYGQERMLKELNERLDSITHSSDEIQGEIERDEGVVEGVKKEVDVLERNKDKEAGSKLDNLTKQLEAYKVEEAKADSELSALQKSLSGDEKKLKEVREQSLKDNNSIMEKGKRLKELDAKQEELREVVKKKMEAQDEAVRQLQASKVGSTSSEGGKSQSSVQEQLRSARMSISNAETRVKDTFFRLKHSREELKKQQAMMKRQDDGYKTDQDNIRRLSATIKSLEDQLSRLDFSKEREEELVREHREVERKVYELSGQVQSLEASLYQMELEYSDPERGFDRSAVKGVVANLISLKDAKYAAALEAIAGGKLYQVVVDTEQTAKKLLEKGNLKRRVTFIPLNKISSNTIHPSVTQKAKQLVGSSEVESAMELVGYDDDLHRAMAYVFGSSFVCTSLDAARKVTFNDAIRKKTVTLDGNSFDPAGLASGGARQKTESVLLKVATLKEKKQQLNSCQSQLQQLNKQLGQLQTIAAKWTELSDKLDVSRNEMAMLHEKAKNSAYGQHMLEIQQLQQNIEEMEKVVEEAKKEKEENEGKMQELEEQLKDREGHMKRLVKAAEDELARCKKALEASKTDLEKIQKECSMLSLEVADLTKENDESSETTSTLITSINTSKQSIVSVQKNLQNCKENVKKWQEKVAQQKEVMLRCHREIEEKSNHLKRLHECLHEKKMKVDELKHQFGQTKKLIKDGTNKLEQMLRKETWIEDEKENFNKPNSTYDFSTCDSSEIVRMIKKSEEARKKLCKNVNTRAMTMLEKAEEQHKDVLEKRPTVTEDRSRIEAMIGDLDLKKQDILKLAVQQINKDFGSIFSTLLPGAFAMLDSIVEDGILKGVEFKVGFGGAWKESLTELSGGQRSLIALSLILSLLLFKPAPLYILDEVDAALDPSHTQNIGRMLKAHFKHSQFIIVSLKEGMFNNANVLFRTNFSEGISSINRISQQGSSASMVSRGRKK